ncbi:hypothetical protein M422DRAFT_257066 [Sphaerobolus stellatus SS14]|uniref:Uncharacterized protein n=1 Tax=Sphaerobolus stellatus (strain SS14) TaxID=990650 RepID=A0A0C9UYQ9_SPHS4|nr:hypothetical protein M422DRAFT_257066 [Sphaerobolus stellatus SS14]
MVIPEIVRKKINEGWKEQIPLPLTDQFYPEASQDLLTVNMMLGGTIIVFATPGTVLTSKWSLWLALKNSSMKMQGADESKRDVTIVTSNCKVARKLGSVRQLPPSS